MEQYMAFDDNVNSWAQQALDQYNGGYSASDINLNACTYLYGIRDQGNADAALAAASHYLHCRYVASRIFTVGAALGVIAVLGYDGVLKAIDTLVKNYSSLDLIYHFGMAPTSTFSPFILAWDFQGLTDGCQDFIASWGNMRGNTSLTASAHCYAGMFLLSVAEQQALQSF
jgi:hypothetical protein